VASVVGIMAHQQGLEFLIHIRFEIVHKVNGTYVSMCCGCDSSMTSLLYNSNTNPTLCK
jgi:hypothetical protein